jgi:hypothetical protein
VIIKLIFSFNCGNTDTLSSGQYLEYQSKARARFYGIENVDDGSLHGLGISVILELVLHHTEYRFTTNDLFPLKAINTLPIPVILESDFLNYNGQIELTISPNEEKTDAFLF